MKKLLIVFLTLWVWPAIAQTMLAGPSGLNPPVNSVGKEGDYFFSTSSNLYYGPKSFGAWPSTPITFTGTIAGAQVLIGSAVSLTSGVSITITSVAVPPGSWNCFGEIVTNPQAGTTQGDFVMGLSNTTNTLPTPGDGYIRQPYAAAIGTPVASNVHRWFNSTLSQNIFLVVNNTFSGGTNSAYGTLRCFRFL